MKKLLIILLAMVPLMGIAKKKKEAKKEARRLAREEKKRLEQEKTEKIKQEDEDKQDE